MSGKAVVRARVVAGYLRYSDLIAPQLAGRARVEAPQL